MNLIVTIVAYLCGIFFLSSRAESASFKELLIGERNKSDRMIEVNVTSRQKSGDREPPAIIESSVEVFVTGDKPDRVLLHENKQWFLSEEGYSACWTDNLQTWRVQTFKTDAERRSHFAMGRMHDFWVIPTRSNVAYLDNNFTIDSVENRDGDAIARFRLREAPEDACWRTLKEQRALTVTGVVTIKMDTGVISDARIEMTARGHSWSFVITTVYKTGPISREIFEMPATIAAKVPADKVKK